jgi:acylphosphatase
MTEKKHSQLHAYIRGRVQGVGFRYFVVQKAQDLGLSGWVRNLRDGRVEVLAEGVLENLNDLLQILRKGPLSAEVRDVEYAFGEGTGEFRGFRVRYIA